MRPCLGMAASIVEEGSRDAEGSGHEERDKAISRQSLSLDVVASSALGEIRPHLSIEVAKEHDSTGAKESVWCRRRNDEHGRCGVQDVELGRRQRLASRCLPWLRKSRAQPCPWCLTWPENSAW